MGCSSSSSAEVVNTAQTIYPKFENQTNLVNKPTAEPKNATPKQKYKLFYFDFTGKAEIIMYCLI